MSAVRSHISSLSFFLKVFLLIRYVEKVLLPYVESVRDSLPITQHDQMALAIFDVFKAHRSDKLLVILTFDRAV
jgi:hypothetical protein